MGQKQGYIRVDHEDKDEDEVAKRILKEETSALRRDGQSRIEKN